MRSNGGKKGDRQSGGREMKTHTHTPGPTAPELLSALRELLENAEAKERYIRIIEDTETSEESPEDLDSPEMARAREVIAKAEGNA